MFGRVLRSLSVAVVCCQFIPNARAQDPYSNWYLAQSITNPAPESGGGFGSAVSGVGNDKVLPLLSIDPAPDPDFFRIS